MNAGRSSMPAPLRANRSGAMSARHGVSPQEVEEVLLRKTVGSEGKSPVNYVPEQTETRGHLFCVVIQFGSGNPYPAVEIDETQKTNFAAENGTWSLRCFPFPSS